MLLKFQVKKNSKEEASFSSQFPSEFSRQFWPLEPLGAPEMS